MSDTPKKRKPDPVYPQRTARRLGVGLVMACLIIAPVVVSPAAMAQQSTITPVVEVALQYIDNPRLAEGIGQTTSDITGGLVDLGVEMRRDTETSSVLFRPSAEIYRYSDGDEDADQFFLDFDANRQGQRSNWRLRANFAREDVFRGEVTSSEFNDIGVGDDVQTGTGRTLVRRERDFWRVRPGLTLDLTERTGLKAEFAYLSAAYDTQELGEAIDFTSLRADLSIVRALTPDSRIELGIFGQQFEPETGIDADAVGARARFEKQVSDISTFFIEAGFQESSFSSNEAPDTDASETALLWNIGYQRRLERTNWRFDIGQSVTPSGAGFLVERDLYRVTMQRELRPRVTLNLSAVALYTETVSDDPAFALRNDRDFVQAGVELGFAMTRSWSLIGLYRLTHQDFADTPGDAQGHEVRLSLLYRPPIPTR